MESVLADLRYALRLLRRSPGFALVTILTLALGIGANTAIFSVVNAVLLRALPFGDPDRLVMVWEENSAAGFPRGRPSPANYVDWKARNRVFADLSAIRGASANLTADGVPEQVTGRAVTANFFSVLKVAPIAGRTFTDDEERAGARVVVIGYGLWQRRYGGDPSIVGRTITMDGASTTVLGVLPRGFVFRARDVEYFIPASLSPATLAQRGSHFLQVVARLKPGVTIEQARDDMAAVAAQLQKEYPATNSKIGSVVLPIDEDIAGNARVQLIVLMAAAGCVLLIACANLASLLLARATGRRGELGIRSALGAPRGRLVRQLLVEALVLSLAGAAAGLALAPAGIAVVSRLIPVGVPDAAVSSVDPRVLVFTLLLGAGTGLVFSLVPALQAASGASADWVAGVAGVAGVNDALQQQTRGTAGTPQRTTRDALVVVQVAVALMLLMAAGLMIRTLSNLRALELGFHADHVLTLRTTLPQHAYPSAAARSAFYARVLDQVRALPGVAAAAYGSTLPFQTPGNTIAYTVDGSAIALGDPGDALLRTGTPSYLATLGAQLIEGRLPDDRDGPDAPPVLVVNETMARRFWPDGGALGHRIRIMSSTNPWRTIVGVVRDVRERGYEPAQKPGVYLPYAQAPDTWAIPEFLIVRTAGDPLDLAAAARRAVASVDPSQPVSAIQPLDAIVDLDVADRQQQMALLGAFAGLAVMLAAVGIYGMLSYGVAQRRREIGLRMALGATSASIMRLVVGRGLVLTAIGIAAGAAGGWAATRTMATLLYGVTPGDPTTFTIVTALLVLVGLIACALPALRATRVSPIQTLRED